MTTVAAEPVAVPPAADAALRPAATTRLPAVALAAWVALCLVAGAWGAALLHAHVHMQIGSPPLTGRFDWRPSLSLLAVVGLGVIAAFLLPVAMARVSWRGLLVIGPVVAVAWGVAINVVDGWSAVTSPVQTEYAATAAGITSPGRFLTTFVAHIGRYNLHTQGHPPGMELVLWALRSVGVSSVTAVAAVYIIGGALAVPAALLALADVAGAGAARTAAPFVLLFPGAIWMVTSADAFFTGVSSWAVALVILATGRGDRRGDAFAVGGGLLFGVSVFLSYGLVLLAAVPLAVALHRRRVRPIALAALGAAAVFVAFALGGFWWFDGLRATRAAYFAGVAHRRPYSYFLIADLAAFALVVGPAAAVALAWLRDRRVWLLAGAGLAVVVAADLSGMSKAEVERIFLPFAPWVLLATAAFAGARGERMVRGLLIAQVATAVGIQALVRSPW
jgi:hypothetical protein